MMPVVVLVLLGGLSEAAGRLLPVVSRRPHVSRGLVIGLLTTGALVDAAVIAVWPLTAWAVAEVVTGDRGGTGLAWTAGQVAPLVLAAVLAFPLLGPLFHLLLLIGVGASLATPLAAAAGLEWTAAAGCVAAAAFGLAVAVEGVRRLVSRVVGTGGTGQVA